METTIALKQNVNDDTLPQENAVAREDDLDQKTQDYRGRQSPSPTAKQEQQQSELEFTKLQRKQKYSEYYLFQKLLGQGAFCQVYQAIDIPTGEMIAVKVIRRKNLNQNDVHLLKQEAEILKTLHHENIVEFKHIREIGGRIFLGMELLHGGQLTSLIKEKKSRNEKFTDEEASTIMKSILYAVLYIHSKGIVHRDLKPDNILVGRPDDFSTIKIADFGLSAKYDHVSFTTLDQHCGTLIFMAPEVALKKEYSKSVDVWSLGIIMYMLLTGGSHPLFSNKDTAETYKGKLAKISQLQFPSHLSVLAKNLYMRLTKFNIAQRYSTLDALQHPWITRINKTLIPLTLPDKMNNLELEVKLKQKISVMFFASMIKIKSTAQIEKSYSNPELVQYKRLLDKVTKKIDKWHEEKQKLNKEQFERDEEYVELDRSPTRFSSSSQSDNDNSLSIGYNNESRTTDNMNPHDKSKKKNPKSNPNSFKLSLLETNAALRRDSLNQNIDKEEQEDFLQFLNEKENSKKGKVTGNGQGITYQRRKSLKKTSLAASPPVKRDSNAGGMKKRMSSKPNNIQTQGFEQNQSAGQSGTTTQTSNQAQPLLFVKQNSEKEQITDQNQAAYIDQSIVTTSSQPKSSFQAYYQSAKHASSKMANQTTDDSFRMSFINSE